MKIDFAWHDKNSRNDFRVWKPYPTFDKKWNGELWYFNLWKWSIILDFRDRGFWGHIMKTIWYNRLKDRQN